MMRSVVEYGDLDSQIDNSITPEVITKVLDEAILPQIPTDSIEQASGSRPRKKRRTRANSQRAKPSMPHWDDPVAEDSSLLYDNAEVTHTEYSEVVQETKERSQNEQEEEESRDLTYEEVWDDSALIDAWNSASAEYEAMHGKGQKWKNEPVKKSPLWYNVPPNKIKLKDRIAVNGTQSPSQQNRIPQIDVSRDEQQNSQTFDFNSFVPTHDPSLPIPPTLHAPNIPESLQADVGVDEAFSHALNAMYWCGYWTATYHARRRGEGNAEKVNNEEPVEETENESGIEEEPEEMEMVGTQR